MVLRMDETTVKHTKVLGDRTTAHVLARLMEVYDSVLLPFGENQRYDLVAETAEGGFLRIQCKTGRLRRGRIGFHACSSSYHHPNKPDRDFKRQHYRGQADFFGVYCPETMAVYLVPVEDVGKVRGFLRVTPPRNNQSKKIRWASDYQIGGDASDWKTAGSRQEEPPAEQPSLLRERSVHYVISPG